MTRIGIVGANGQVGTEICMLLKHWPDVDVSAICRRGNSGVALRHLGIDCRIWDSSSPTDANNIFGDLDLVADFSLPSGGVRRSVAIHEQIMGRSLGSARPKTPYVFASSQMAFGISPNRTELREYWFAGTTYGATKRRAEAMVSRVGRELDIPTYLLRLGQVHGFMQPVTKALREQAATSPTYQVPSGPSFTVFCYTLAEALINISRQLESPGRYTAVSNPAWTWREFFQHLGATDIQELELSSKSKFSLAALSRGIHGKIINGLQTRKEFLQAHVLCHTPNLEQRLKVKNWCQSASSSLRVCEQFNVIPWNSFHGLLPGKRLESISDSRRSMQSLVEQCIADLESRKPR